MIERPAFKAGVLLHLSNQTEALVDHLATLLDAPCGGPLDAETILVQGPGMATWLSMQLARRRGICAHVNFTYPRAFVWQAFRAYLGAQRIEEAELTETRLFWLTLQKLPPLLAHPAFAAVRQYVERDRDGMRLFQLAQRIATTFDQYLIYRPELIRIWEAGHDDGAGEHLWQPLLWRALRTDIRGHIAALEHEFLREVVGNEERPAQGIPERLSLFGTTSLPPLFLRVLTALGARCALHVYAFAAATHERPGALLRSLGQQGDEFRELLHSAARDTQVTLLNDVRVEPPEAMNLLGAVQRLLFAPEPPAAGTTSPKGGRRGRQNLDQLSLFGEPNVAPEAAVPPRAEAPVTREALDPRDPSLQIHACHSPMREVEVLHDVLLGLLDTETGIKPHEVIVLTPDVETYAPLIEAVFAADGQTEAIPFRISDRSARSDSPILESLARVFDLVGGRATASEVLDLLTLAPIQKKFELDASALETLSRWIAESGIRWGVDQSFREGQGQPATEQNTWRMGLDRLLLGYAWPRHGRSALGGALPYDYVEGQDAELLGRFVEFAESLFSRLDSLSGGHSVPEWHARATATLDALIHVESDQANESHRIRQTLALLQTEAEEVGCDELITLASFQSLLEGRLDSGAPERGFLQNGVTFCAMLPMRTIPFRVICLLGMNDGTFPRAQPSVDFDLISSGTRGRQPGDRDRRRDDRQLFLEALMAARDHLIITHTGQSIRDNAHRPPSVVVSELLDAIASCRDPLGPYEGEADRVEKLIDEAIVRHPLQAFSPSYFDGTNPRLYSYSKAFGAAAQHLRGNKLNSAQFFETPLSPAEASEDSQGRAGQTLELDGLVRFWGDPHRALFTERLRLSLRNEDTELLEREPLALDGLEKYQLKERVLMHLEQGITLEQSRQLVRAEGLLPPGFAGDIELEEGYRFVSRLLLEASRHRVTEELEPLRIRVALGETLLDGEVRDLYGNSRVVLQTSQVGSKHRLNLWLQHLALCSLRPETESILLGRGSKPDVVDVLHLAPVANPVPLLAELIEFRSLGLRAPLPWAGNASWAYVAALRQPKNEGDTEGALAKAVKHYQNDLTYSDGYLEKAFGESVPPFDGCTTLGPDFAALAHRVLDPLLDHVQEEES